MSMISRMSSTLTFPGTLRSMFTELGELAVQGNTFSLAMYESASSWYIVCILYLNSL